VAVKKEKHTALRPEQEHSNGEKIKITVSVYRKFMPQPDG